MLIPARSGYAAFHNHRGLDVLHTMSTTVVLEINMRSGGGEARKSGGRNPRNDKELSDFKSSIDGELK